MNPLLRLSRVYERSDKRVDFRYAARDLTDDLINKKQPIPERQL